MEKNKIEKMLRIKKGDFWNLISTRIWSPYLQEDLAALWYRRRQISKFIVQTSNLHNNSEQLNLDKIKKDQKLHNKIQFTLFWLKYVNSIISTWSFEWTFLDMIETLAGCVLNTCPVLWGPCQDFQLGRPVLHKVWWGSVVHKRLNTK